MSYHLQVPKSMYIDEDIKDWLKTNIKPTCFWFLGFNNFGIEHGFGYVGRFRPYLLTENKEIMFKRKSDLIAFKLRWL